MNENEPNGIVEETNIQPSQNQPIQNEKQVQSSQNQGQFNQNYNQNFNQNYNQPVTPNQNVYYDNQGRPLIAQNMNAPVTPKAPQKTKRTGCFIASIITLIIAVGFTIFSTYYFFELFMPTTGSDSTWEAVLAFILYIFSGIGLALAIPGILLSIASLVCSCFSVKSSKKGIRITSGFIIAFSIISLLVAIVIPFILLLVAGNSGS